MKNLLFGNEISHIVGYWFLSFANLYIRDYDSPEEKRKEVTDSLSERATPCKGIVCWKQFTAIFLSLVFS